MTLLGWTLEQWAIAIGRLGIANISWRAAIDVKKAWKRLYNYEPGEIHIIGVGYSVDHVSAAKIFELPL